MAEKPTTGSGGSTRLAGETSLDLVAVEEGARMTLIGGRTAEVVHNPRDGMWILVRFVESPDDPDLVGEEELVFWADVVAVI